MENRASTLKSGACYKGAIRDTRNKIIWQCDHYHTNRDNDSYQYVRYGRVEGMSALTCAHKQIMARKLLANAELESGR